MRNRYRKLVSAQRAAAEVPEHFTGTVASGTILVNYERMASKCRLMFGQSTFRASTTRRGTISFSRSVRERGVAATGRAHKKRQTGLGGGIAAAQAGRACKEPGAKGRLSYLVRGKRGQSAVAPLGGGYTGIRQAPFRAVAVCDVSGSMYGEPMEVAVALSLLLCDVADEPWRNKICTFSRAPKFVTVPSATTDNLAERA